MPAARAQTRGSTRRKPFDVRVVLDRVRAAVAGMADAAMFALAAEGYDGLFEQLVGCMISIRTRDEVSLPTARQLFEVAHTPAAMAVLTTARIDALISACTFHQAKARQIRALAQRVAAMGGELPCDFDVLTSFSGVGPKCANLALGIACGATRISVDVHVHRITNRWGYVDTASPEATMTALERKLPREHWVEINRLLVPFGKHVCTGRAPKCSTCPVLEYCRQVGVEEHR